MITIRTRNTGFQAIVKLPYGGGRLTKVFPKKTPARQWAKIMEGRALVLQQQAMEEGDPHRTITKAMVCPELYAIAPSVTDDVDGMTLGEFCQDHYPRWRRLKGTDRCTTRTAQIEWWKDQLGRDTLLSDISKGDIATALADYGDGLAETGPNRGKRRSAQSVDRLKAAISSLLTAAVEWGHLKGNVAQGVPKFAKGQSMGIGKQLGRAERKALLDAAGRSRWERMYLLVMLALVTGGRRGELLKLRWEYVSLDALTVTFCEGTTKNGKARTVGISDEVAAELCRYQSRTGLVFPSPRCPDKPFAFRNHWEQCLLDSEIACRFHDLRHTAASILVNSGMAIHAAKDILGHSSIAVTERYLHKDDGVNDQMRSIMSAAVA
ncbi:tyrosine-type recombinase/integrase [Halioglobus pacificus]|uniref:Tyr recombinase domain-containing protein n=1 Tax=Parahalioglobus pacificus TaxID=930806 RepID=A0A918XFS1_9GAMM|nr:site-specific integrase [Halioglobus pacificus]GHD30046.1 hypothetical protein GCM10007053_11400 [Halioglobus pacificus]